MRYVPSVQGKHLTLFLNRIARQIAVITIIFFAHQTREPPEPYNHWKGKEVCEPWAEGGEDGRTAIAINVNVTCKLHYFLGK